MISILYLLFGLGGSNGIFNIHIFASSTFLAIWGWDISLSITIPSINWVSPKLPPTFPSTLIMSKFTSFLSKSATDKIASTAILANCSWYFETTLEQRAVLAAFFKFSLSFSVRLISWEIFSRFSKAYSHALSNPSMIFKGCIPLSNNFWACSNKAPANTTTPVVPSPLSSSWDLDNSTNNFAMGCSIFIFSTIVAPSFVTVTSPSLLTSILSIPFGPIDDRRKLLTPHAAKMFD